MAAISERGLEEVAIKLVPGIVIRGEGKITRVRQDERIVLPESVGAIADQGYFPGSDTMRARTGLSSM
jgi:hypothetical protein